MFFTSLCHSVHGGTSPWTAPIHWTAPTPWTAPTQQAGGMYPDGIRTYL